MKNWTSKLAMMMVALVTLTACPDKNKGGGAAAVPPATGVCTLDQNGQCVGGTAYTGGGQWSGALIVSPGQMPLYRNFLNEHGLCNNYRCNAMLTQWVGVSMNIRHGRARVAITPYTGRGWLREKINRRGNSYLVNGGNGFQIVLRDDNYYIQGPQPQIYPQPIVAPNTGAIQLVGNFTTQYGEMVSVNLYYRGVIIASGQVPGRRTYYQGQPDRPYGVNQAPGVLPGY